MLEKSIREETISFAQEIIRVNSPSWHEVLEEVSPDFMVICEPNDCCVSVGQKGRAES